jgi:hypothetical protein
MAENEEWTCGKGVASNAALPERIGALLGAVSDVLQNHTRSLNAADANGAEEVAAYRRLVEEHRGAASALAGLAATMRGYRDLPPAEHDMVKLMDAASLEVMEALVRAQEDVLALLQQRAAQYGEMLRRMTEA